MDSLVKTELQKDLDEKSSNYLRELTANDECNNNACNYKNGNNSIRIKHLGIISVDTANHIICGATVDYADKKDSQTTVKIISQTVENLEQSGLIVDEVLACTASLHCQNLSAILQ